MRSAAWARSFTLSGICSAEDGQEKLNQLEKALNTIDRLQALTEKMSKEKKLQCLTAVANEAFC
jgi:hypothetical protein